MSEFTDISTLSDDGLSRAFIANVLADYPRSDLFEGRNGMCVEQVVKSVVRQTPDWQSEKKVLTYGRWYGRIRLGDASRWAFWVVCDDDDTESPDNGRRVELCDDETEAARHFVNELAAICDTYDRPRPEDWPDDGQERAYQQQLLTRYIENVTPYWRALTGLPLDLIVMCVQDRSDPLATWQMTRGEPTAEQVRGLRLLADLRAGAPGET